MAQNNTDLFSYSSGGHKSNVSLKGLKSGVSRTSSQRLQQGLLWELYGLCPGFWLPCSSLRVTGATAPSASLLSHLLLPPSSKDTGDYIPHLRILNFTASVKSPLLHSHIHGLQGLGHGQPEKVLLSLPPVPLSLSPSES